MSETPRFIVSDLGFSYAVHDTGERQSYAFRAGEGKEHPSSSPVNGVRVELFATREEAQRLADELNARHRPGTSKAG